MVDTKKNPLLVGARQGVEQNNLEQAHDSKNYCRSKSFKKIFNRSGLPKPLDYYRQQFSKLRINKSSDWMKVNCCFHEDHNPSLSIHLKSGGFKCFSCGAKGGDVLAFHMQRYGLTFIAAVTALEAWYE